MLFKSKFSFYAKYKIKGGLSMREIISTGGGYISGSGVTTENMELIPSSPSDWTYDYTIKKLSFYSTMACTIVINKKYKIPLQAGRGFEVDYKDPSINSFVIEEANVTYEFIGVY